MYDKNNWYEDTKQSEWMMNNDGKEKEKAKEGSHSNPGKKWKITGVIGGMLLMAIAGGIFGAFAAMAAQGSGQEQPRTVSSITRNALERSLKNDISSKRNDSFAIPREYKQSNSHTKAEVVAICAQSVVGIKTEGTAMTLFGQQPYQGSGSGIIYTSDGYIVTNNHVIENASKIVVILSDGTEYNAKIIGKDENTDLALLKIDEQNLCAVALGDSDSLAVGEDIIVIGNPLGEFAGSVTSGIISAVERAVKIDDKSMTLMQTDAAINPGNSGGGLFNAAGELIGIVNAKIASATTEGLGFAIPVNKVKSVVMDLKEKGYVGGKAYLGVYTQNVPVRGESMNEHGKNGMLYYDEAPGKTAVQIIQVMPESAAEKAGLQSEDLILKVAGVQVNTNKELAALLDEYNPGEQAIITIERDGKQKDITVVFDEYKPHD